MIVKNEAKTLEKTIESVRNYVDEIVIGVDEASNDGTKELVDKLADKVITIYLSEELSKKGPKDDSSTDWGFSRARNMVLEQCTGDWRLILDGHELVHNPDKMHEAIKEAESKGADGIDVNLHFELDFNGIPGSIFRQGRVFKFSVRYNSPIHNVPVVRSYHFTKAFYIEHCKKEQDEKSREERNIQRSNANIDGFRKKVLENPKESRRLFYLGEAYRESDRFAEAIETYKDYLEVSTWREERWHARTEMAGCYRAIGQDDKAREQYSRALDEFPQYAEGYYYMADLAYHRQQFQEALVWLEKCIQMDMPECELFLTPAIYMFYRWDLLSMTYEHLGQPLKAIEAANKIIEQGIKAPQVETNIRAWKDDLSITLYFKSRRYKIMTHGFSDHISRILNSYKKFYELPLLEKIRGMNLKGTYIDIGAHIGNHSVFFANECPSERLISIEADPITFKILEENSKNNIKKPHLLFNLAVTAEAGTFDIVRPDPNNTGMNRVKPGTEIIGRPLWQILDGLGEEWHNISLIKIDAEGLEYNILLGADKFIEYCRPVVVVEVAESDSGIPDFFEDLNYVKEGVYNDTPTEIWIPK